MKMCLELPLFMLGSGGVNRTMRIALELPHFHAKSGGLEQCMDLVERIPENIEVHIRWQKVWHTPPEIAMVEQSVGFPDASFPECDVGITYSDTPYPDEFAALPQVKRKYALMLSYGMAIHRERKVALHRGIRCMSTTRRTQSLIRADGGDAEWIGFGFDSEKWTPNTEIERKPYVAMLYNPCPAKNYAMAVGVANRLIDNGIVQGCITFGMADGYDKAVKPKNLIKHYTYASPEQVRDVFSESMIFIMPSSTEGLNLTPLESTLCGCPAVLCDGAIGEIFHNGVNSIVTDSNPQSIYIEASKLAKGWLHYSPVFLDHMRNIMKEYTWDKHIQRLLGVIQ